MGSGRLGTHGRKSCSEGKGLHPHLMTSLEPACNHNNLPKWFRLPVYPTLVLKSLGTPEVENILAHLKPGEAAVNSNSSAFVVVA